MDMATKQDLNELETRLKQEIDSRTTDLENRLVEQMRNIETSLLTEFRKWAVPVNVRLRTSEIIDPSLSEPVTFIEERLNELDRRNRAL